MNIAPEIERNKITPKYPYLRVPKSWETDLDIAENRKSATGFHQGPRQNRRGVKLIIWSWAAALIDSTLIFGIGLVFLVSFLVVVKSQWGTLSTQENDFVFIAGGALLFLLSFFYMVILRGFLGFSLGEWACGLRLGSPQQRISKEYILRVLLRSTLLFATGIVILPIASLLMGRDLPGKISGISLFSLR